MRINDYDPAVATARKAEQALFDFYGITAKEHYTTLPEQHLRVRILEFGQEGAPLVIVPGNTGDVFPLTSLIARLADRHIYAINRPGGGLSDGMDHNSVNIRDFASGSLNFILDNLHLRNVDVVAHSMGAHWSTLLAMDHPEKVRRLVLLGNPGNIMTGRPPLALRLLTFRPFSKLILNILVPKDKDHGLGNLVKMGHGKMFVASLPSQLRDAYYHFTHLPHYPVSAISLLQNMIPNLAAEDLGRLNQPTALILGTNDNFLSPKNGEKIVDALPEGTFFPIEGSGHLPWLEHPNEVARIIHEFLGS